MVGKTDLDSMSGESGFGAATPMGGFAQEKGPDVSLALEPFWASIFTSSASVRGSDKQSISNTPPLSGYMNTNLPKILLLLLQYLQIQFSTSLNACFTPF